MPVQKVAVSRSRQDRSIDGTVDQCDAGQLVDAVGFAPGQGVQVVTVSLESSYTGLRTRRIEPSG